MRRLLGGLASLLVLLGFAGLMAWSMSMTVRGMVAGLTWDKKSTFQCYGNLVVTLKDVQVALPNGARKGRDITDFLMPSMPDFDKCEDGPGGCPIIDAAGNCQMEIVDSALSAPRAIRAAGNARVTIRNSKIVGRIERSGSAVVTGLPDEDRKTALADLSRRFGAGACDGVVGCYRDSGAYGNISGRLAVDIGADGHATAARYESGDAPPGVRKCLIGIGQKVRILSYDGQPGLLTCDYAGSLTPGTQMMNTTPTFTHRAAR